MKYLSGASSGLDGADPRIGIIIQPGNRLHTQLDRFAAWAADNGCYAAGDRFDVDAWLAWLARLPRRGCLFATAPDVVGDAGATLARSAPYLPVIRDLGFPPALVAQDGLEGLAVPWDTFDVLFVGGTTDWKLGPGAAELIAEARRRGKWVHVGRVNSGRRFKLFAALGADSADGTILAYGPDVNRRRVESWLNNPPLELGA